MPQTISFVSPMRRRAAATVQSAPKTPRATSCVAATSRCVRNRRTALIGAIDVSRPQSASSGAKTVEIYAQRSQNRSFLRVGTPATSVRSRGSNPLNRLIGLANKAPASRSLRRLTGHVVAPRRVSTAARWSADHPGPRVIGSTNGHARQRGAKRGDVANRHAPAAGALPGALSTKIDGAHLIHVVSRATSASAILVADPVYSSSAAHLCFLLSAVIPAVPA